MTRHEKASSGRPDAVDGRGHRQGAERPQDHQQDATEAAEIARLNDALLVKRELAALLRAGRIDALTWRCAVATLRQAVLS